MNKNWECGKGSAKTEVNPASVLARKGSLRKHFQLQNLCTIAERSLNRHVHLNFKDISVSMGVPVIRQRCEQLFEKNQEFLSRL
jgi:hypothetical protein